jgi:hypothetical protein
MAKRPLGSLAEWPLRRTAGLSPVAFAVFKTLNEHGCIWFRHLAGCGDEGVDDPPRPPASPPLYRECQGYSSLRRIFQKPLSNVIFELHECARF